MANIRIDNSSEDTITAFLDGKQYTVQEDEKLSVENIEKGGHTLTIHRTRIPQGKDESSQKPFKEEQSEHYQLDGIFKINVSAGKSIVTVNRKITAHEKIGLNAIFSSYEISVSGGELLDTREEFASTAIRKKFSLEQLKEAFVPVGIGALIFLAITVYALYGLISGTPVKISDRTMTLPWTIGSAAVTTGCFGYIFYVLLKSKKFLKKYSK